MTIAAGLDVRGLSIASSLTEYSKSTIDPEFSFYCLILFLFDVFDLSYLLLLLDAFVEVLGFLK